MNVQGPDATMREWLAVQVRCGREELSASHLRTRGYDVFLPSYKQHRRWSDRVKVISRALFEGYVFCRADARVSGLIITAPGVIRIVGDGRAPLPVPLHEIEAIQRIVETQLAVEPWQTLRAGQRVRVEQGPLRGIEGVVLMLRSRHRLVVSIEMLQRAVAVEIEPEWVSLPSAALLCR
jgi:transcription antitermination factor NusG